MIKFHCTRFIKRIHSDEYKTTHFILEKENGEKLTVKVFRFNYF